MKSAPGTAIITPVIPPTVKVIRASIVHIIGVVKRIRPLYMVNSQLKILTPGWDRDNHGRNWGKGIHIGARTHSEEVMQPNHKR